MGTGVEPGSLVGSTFETAGNFVAPPPVMDQPPAVHTRPHRRVGGLRGAFAAAVAVGTGLVGAAFAPGGNDNTAEAGVFVEDYQETTGHLQAGDVLVVKIPGAEGGDKAISGNLTSDRSGANGYVTAFTCGETIPLASDLNPVAGQVRTNRLIAYPNENGEVCFYTFRDTDLIVDVDSIVDVTPFPNQRTDTRVTGNHLDAGEVLEVFVPEAVGGKTVVGNLTSDRSDANGYITAYPCDQKRPLASDLNPRQGEVVANRFIGKASKDGKVCFYTFNGTDLIFDANGIANSSQPIPNQRTDTRETGQHLKAGEVLRVNVFDALGGGVITGNLTSDRTGENGYVTAWSCDGAMPIKSDLNPRAGQVTSNRLIAATNAQGDICFFTFKDTDLIVDVNGLLQTVQVLPEHFRFDTRKPHVPGAGEGIEMMSVEGSKWVDSQDIAIRCEYAHDPYGNVWNRYTYINISNQQPSDPSYNLMGAAVLIDITNPEFPVGDNQYRTVIPSARADYEGNIAGWSTTYLSGEPSEARASRLPEVFVEIELTENVPPGNRTQVGKATYEFQIPSCSRI